MIEMSVFWENYRWNRAEKSTIVNQMARKSHSGTPRSGDQVQQHKHVLPAVHQMGASRPAIRPAR
jgi:hypothetical protein